MKRTDFYAILITLLASMVLLVLIGEALAQDVTPIVDQSALDIYFCDYDDNEVEVTFKIQDEPGLCDNENAESAYLTVNFEEWIVTFEDRVWVLTDRNVWELQFPTPVP